MAIAEGKAFGQIKGSYIKLKVKSPPSSVKVGDHVVASLSKVTPEKLSATFVSKVSEKDKASDEQRQTLAIWQSVQSDAHIRSTGVERRVGAIT